jgi:effector-binding domain-containing protein
MTDLAPAQPYDTGVRIELDPAPLAVVRHHDVTLADVPDLFDAGYGVIGALVGTGALVPAGPALAVYRGDPSGRFDLDLGFPVSVPLDEPITSAGLEVVGTTLPAGPARAATHLGAYDDLGAAWARLVAVSDATPTGVWIEVYVTDPSVDPDALRTDLYMPVAG